jgi:hypothetical protein
MSEAAPLPSAEQQQRAKWDLLLLDIESRRRQARWEAPKALARGTSEIQMPYGECLTQPAHFETDLCDS